MGTGGRKERTLQQRNAIMGYVMVSPIIIGILLFSVVPVFFSLFISFNNWDMLHPREWVGLANYKGIFSGSTLGTVWKNTGTYCAIAIPGAIFFGLLLALAMNAKIRGVALYRTAFFMPNITTTVAVCIVWMWLYNKDFGLLNNILRGLGLPPVKWISSRQWAMPSVSFMSIWQGMGYDMILITAGLKAIDETYYEAAMIDGANGWQSFWRITLPMLTPTLFFLTVTHCINYVQMFDAAYILTEGGPGKATTTVVMQIYNTAFQYFRMGEASSYAWVLFAVVLLMTIGQFKLQDKWVNYDV